ncbi:MAG TPA: Ni/Fe-hydrogenase, b-type cytochrome subunit [Thermodesulfovibrionales bacterium]|nr:Ni/Fe-hydrogenase, b-type cytochrome subunit [Thermodesulfovibrionales bacterium]
MGKRVYVWEPLLRVTHWLTFLSIVLLIVTGLYIGDPYGQFSMATMRFLHFVASYVFTMSFLLRIYLWFAGNEFERLDQFIPLSSERRKNLVDTMAFYLFLRKELPRCTGSTGIAGLTYFILFIVLFITILTGFALYSETHVGGLWTLLGGWLLAFWNTGTIRLIHHISMWIIIPFAILHVYISFHNDIIEKSGLVMSIFTGYKTEE